MSLTRPLEKRFFVITSLLCVLVLSAFVRGAKAEAADSAAEIVDLRCESMTEPLGIDAESPRLSWKMNSDSRGEEQLAYEILISSSERNLEASRGDIWDSGKIASGISNNIAADIENIQSGTRYYWKVLVWDNNGNVLSSAVTWFETGLLSQKTDWQGSFIAPDRSDKSALSTYSYECDFKIDQRCAGFVFDAADSDNFLMWQINAADRTNDQKVYLRPHAWVNGAATVLQDIDISNVILWDARNDFHHLKIDIVGNKQIRTSIDGILVDTREWDVSFDKTGFREDGAESACFDNLVICENNDEVCSEKFDSSNNPFKKEPVDCLGRKVLSFAGEGAVLTDLREGTGEPMFRKEFSVTKTVSQARLYATALGVYEAYINGQKVGNDKLDPGWTNYKKTLLYQTFDITDMLKQGDNAVGAVVGSGWYAGKTGNDFLACYGVDKAFLGQIVITYTDGTRDVIGTDNTWKCQETGPYVATDLEDGETYDATRESDGWNEAGFNADGWIGTKIADENTINTKIKISALDIKARNGEAVQQIQELVPVKTKASTENSVIYNLGQNISGVIRLKAAGKAGQTVRIRYGEMLNSDGSLYTENLRNAKATDYYTFKGGNAEEVFEPSFTTHGFQYIEISWDSEAPAISSATGIALSDNLEKTGNVETSNSELNQLFSNINWSQRDNYLSIPTDCPQRDERLGWTGDAHIFARTGSLNYNSKQFMERYLEILRTDQKSDGMVMTSILIKGA